MLRWDCGHSTKKILVLGFLSDGLIPNDVPLFKIPFRVQVHNAPAGCRFYVREGSLNIANSIGEFLEYDANNNSNLWKLYMRIRVIPDVRNSLKRTIKIKKLRSELKEVQLKYKKLKTSCYPCGHVGSHKLFLTSFSQWSLTMVLFFSVRFHFNFDRLNIVVFIHQSTIIIIK